MPKKDGEVGILKALQGCFANKQQVNVIGWWCRHCLSPANQVALFSVPREQIHLMGNMQALEQGFYAASDVLPLEVMLIVPVMHFKTI